MSENRALTIGLLWHSVNSDNLGVGAITISNVALVERAAAGLGVPVRFLVLGWLGRRKPYVNSPRVQAVHIRTRHFVKPVGGLLSAIRRCDIVFDIGAGDSFSDIYGLKRFMFLALSKIIVLLARRPLILSPQTIGPFERWWTRAVAKGLMRRCRAIITRDHMSFEAVKRLRLLVETVEATDVAFCLPYNRPASGNGSRPKVGINVSGLLFHGGYTRQNMFRLKADYPQLVRDLLHQFTHQGDCEVHLVSHVLSDASVVEDDYRVARQLQEEFPNVVLGPCFASPSEAKSYIASMDFFCGSRMHACIAAYSTGVPVVPIAYSRKFAGVFESLGYTATADCRQETTEQIVAKIMDCFEHREKLRTLVQSGNAIANEKLEAYRAVVRTCFLEALARQRS